MTFQVNYTTIHFDPIPSGAAVFNAPPGVTDQAAHRALGSKTTKASHPRNIKPLSDTSATAQAVKATLLATGFAAAAVLGGWKIALGGYIIYRGARLIQGKGKDSLSLNPDVDGAETSDDFVAPDSPLSPSPLPKAGQRNPSELPKEEQSATPALEANDQDLEDLIKDSGLDAPSPRINDQDLEDLIKDSGLDSSKPKPHKLEAPNLPPLPKIENTAPKPTVSPVDKPKDAVKPQARAQAEAPSAAQNQLTYLKAISNGWKKGNYFHEKIYKVIGISAFWVFNWLFNKIMKGQMQKAARWATKIGIGVGAVLTFCLIFPWIISLFQIPFKRKAEG